MQEIRIRVAGEVDDTEESAELTSRLRDELLELDVDDVTRPSAVAPDGAKGDAVAWAELVVTVSASLPPLVQAIRSWRDRQRGATVVIEHAGDRLVLADATPDVQNALVKDWLARHGST